MKELFAKIYNLTFFKLVLKFRLYKAKKKAMTQYKLTGKQFFVLKSGNIYITIGSNGRKAYNAMMKKQGKKELSYMDINNICAYKTPTNFILN